MAKAKARKTVGVYERPPPSKWPKVLAVIAALLIIVAVVLVLASRADAAIETPSFVRSAMAAETPAPPQAV